ncbi:MAG: hypothetical protein VCG02_09340 [Verrucomicrobiota bacterium]
MLNRLYFLHMPVLRGVKSLRILARPAIVSALLVLSACSKELPVPRGERIWVVEAPEAELTLTVMGRVDHRRRESVKAPVAELRLAWMASEGSLVEAGEVVARYDTELLDLWLQSNREDLAILERRTRAAGIANERALYNLRALLVDSEADHKAVVAAYALSKDLDVSERGILERELDLSRKSLADAREQLDAIREMQSVGGVAAAEVREAMAAYQRAFAEVRVPEANLAVFDDVDGRRTRMQLDQDLARLGLALGAEDQPGSLRNRLVIFMAQQEQDLQWVKLEATRLEEEAGDARVVIDDAVHRTEQDGVVDPHKGHHGVPLVAGAELGSREIVSVISPADAVIKVRIPEALRETVRIKSGDVHRVQVRIPSLGPQWNPGHLQSVSVVKHRVSGGERAYRGTVLLDQPPTGLRPGAGIECRIRVPVPASAVVIPRWWATRTFRPVVRMATGENRRLHAQVVGDWLLVSGGLAIGDRILPPESDAGPNLVLYAAVEVPDREEITIGHSRSWEWEVEELVDDGSEVVEGQVLARLRRAMGRETRENAGEIEQLKADAARQLARMSARGRLGEAFMDWQKARIYTEVARVDYEIDRQENTASVVIQGEVDARLATIQREQVEAEAERLSASIYEDIRSGNQRAQDRLGAEVARRDHDRAMLSASAARHSRNWPATWTARQKWRRQAAMETTAEQAYIRAQTRLQRDLTAAEASYTRRMKYVERLGIEAVQQEITSPRSGRIYHNPVSYYPIEVGRRLPTGHLFNMPRGHKRQFELHVPARRYRDFAVGQEMSFYLPAEGAKRQTGRVIHIAYFFEKWRPRQGHGWNGHRGAGEPEPEDIETTVRVTVEFECAGEDAAPPGMTVVVELDA